MEAGQGRHAADARHEPGLQRARRSRFRRGAEARAVLGQPRRSIPTRPRRRALWLVPKSHEYETWSDARAFNGVATIQQPQVLPLYGGHSAHEVLAVLQGNTSPNPQELVREHWQALERTAGAAATSRAFWHEALRAGIVADSAAPPLPVPPRRDISAAVGAAAGSRSRSASDCCSGPTRSIWDGRFADNAWLLELPRPFTRLTWDNAALIAPANGRPARPRNRGCGR